MLWTFFFAVCVGLGYPTLNRYDPGVSNVDATEYSKMVRNEAGVAPHFRHRVLIPYLARPIFRAAVGRVGSWNPAYFALLLVNSWFVSGTAYLLFIVASLHIGSPTIALLSSAIYLLNFAVPNLLLAGLVDSGEAFFLLALVGILSAEWFFLLPLAAVLGSLAKETFLPFALVFCCNLDSDEQAAETAREADHVACGNWIGRHRLVIGCIDTHKWISAFSLDLCRHVEIELRKSRDYSGRSERPQLLVRLRLVIASWIVPAETSAA